jgi:hypothetical protein
MERTAAPFVSSYQGETNMKSLLPHVQDDVGMEAHLEKEDVSWDYEPVPDDVLDFLDKIDTKFSATKKTS